MARRTDGRRTVPALAGRRIARNAIIGAGLLTLAGALQGVGAGRASTAPTPAAVRAVHASAPAATLHHLRRR